MAKETKVKDIDITKSGPMTFRDLQEANQEPYTNLSPEFQSFSMNVGANTAPTSLYDARAHGEQMVATSLEGTATPWGESMFDEPTATEAQFQELGDIRANNQPWYAQIGAGLAKGAILAGTTFLDGTVGLIFGAGTAIGEGRWSGLWDNDFSKAMQSVNEWSEQALPNYYTRAEQEQPWYENIFTANFLGDKFIKNLGFTVGAFYSVGVTAAGLKVTKLPQLIGAIAKSSKAPAIVNTAVGATISAVNEGRIEALNNSKDWFELHKAQLDDSLRERLNAIQAEYEANAGKELVRSGVEGNQFVDPAYVKYQDAIAKGMAWREEKKCDTWTVPYLPIDPTDVGRNYDADVIRINSQSGKGGVAFVMDTFFGFKLPRGMHKEFADMIQKIAERQGEVAPEQIMEEFQKNYLDRKEPYHFKKCKITDFESAGDFTTVAVVTYTDHGVEKQFEGVGNGPIDAVQRGLEEELGINIKVLDYSEHALTSGSGAQAASYIHMMDQDRKRVTYGVGISSNITRASLRGIFSAVNRLYGDN